MRQPSFRVAAACALTILAACTGGSATTEGSAVPASSSPPGARPAPPTPPVSPGRAGGLTRPAWLGTRVLPLRPDGIGQIRPTPRVLRNRRLPTIDLLPPPSGPGFAATVRRVPPDVAARSSWKRDCPVELAQLRYVRVSFWGFDEKRHTGELLVHRSVASDVVGVFRSLYRERFPIEEMRIVEAHEIDAPPTGDGNNTTAFVCRPAVGSTRFSAHAYGLAIDINPFHNPYVKGEVVLPELASAYKNRGWERPGMIFEGDHVVTAFAGIGWSWGGHWRTLVDPMHFSATGN